MSTRTYATKRKRTSSTGGGYKRTKYQYPTVRAVVAKSYASQRQPKQYPLTGVDRTIHKFRQFYSSATITQANNAEVVANLSMVVSGLPNISPFTALYDRYRVPYLEFTFCPRFNGATNQLATVGTPGAALVPPRIYVAIDRDGNVPNSVDGIRQYQTCQTHFYDTFTIRFKPGVVGYAYTGSTNAPALEMDAPWLDWAQTGIQHYGLVYGVPNMGAVTPIFQVWDVDLYVGLECCNIR